MSVGSPLNFTQDVRC